MNSCGLPLSIKSRSCCRAGRLPLRRSNRCRSSPALLSFGLVRARRKPVYDAEVLVESEVCIEGVILPTPESFDQSSPAFGHEVGNLAVGELLLPLVAEDGKGTIDVAALGDLRVKEDATGTCLLYTSPSPRDRG